MLREITDKIEWEKLHETRTVPSGHFLQSWEWGEFQISLGRNVFRFTDENFLAQIVELPLPSGKKYWFCPKGPVLASRKWQVASGFINELKNKAKEARAVFLRIEPTEKPADKHGPIGSCLSVRSIDPSSTSIVDLTKTEQELLAAMHPKTRYNIRVAEKHRVKVDPWLGGETSGRSGEAAWGGFASIMALLEETAKRDGFHLHPRGYYEKQIKMPGVEVLGAECESKMLAAAIVMFDPSASLGAGTATYLHGASSNEMRNVMAPYALHWAIIKRAKERGMKYYDLWGISDDPKSGWAGITRFKRGWGGADVFSPGTYDLPVSRFWYSVYALARRLRP